MSQYPALQDMMPLLPELILACGAMLVLMVGVMVGERSSAIVNGWCVIILVAAGAALLAVPAGPHSMFGGSFLVDDYARFLKILTLVGSAGALLLSLDYLTLEKQQKFEYGALFLLATLGMLMLISASDLIALYLGLELMSLPLYVIAASNRENLRSTEAGLKYFVLGALSSGMLLYGASLIYG
ncbi:MAG: proton-conducting transporter membrane subunit, partial [Pseudolabrys sp.]